MKHPRVGDHSMAWVLEAGHGIGDIIRPETFDMCFLERDVSNDYQRVEGNHANEALKDGWRVARTKSNDGR